MRWDINAENIEGTSGIKRNPLFQNLARKQNFNKTDKTKIVPFPKEISVKDIKNSPVQSPQLQNSYANYTDVLEVYIIDFESG